MMPAGIEFVIHSWWRVGTGAGVSAQLDATCARDRDGLPFIPGKQVRGLARDAVRRAESFGWVACGVMEHLFGSDGFENSRNGERHPVSATTPGRLWFGDARLDAADRAVLSQKPDLRKQLFSTLHSTAISRDTGTALEGSLRSEEVAVPMTLVAEVEMADSPDAVKNWKNCLERAMPLIRAVGARRTRGLGRASVRFRRAL